MKNTVLVPAQAQQLGQQGPYVYVINAEDVAELRPIVPGQRQGPMVSVLSGLKPGERVVMTGHSSVMPSNKVMVMNGRMPAPPAGAANQVTLAQEKK
jgi:multidrug efflux pump subunit AcrA (membrane-fusion protein)